MHATNEINSFLRSPKLSYYNAMSETTCQILLLLQDKMYIKSSKISIKKYKKMPIYFYGKKCGKDILRFTITVFSMFCPDKEMRLES